MSSTENKNIKDFYVSSFAPFASKLNGESKSYLHEIRTNALEQLKAMNFPTRKDEEWKYTNVSPILNTNFNLSSGSKNSSPDKSRIEKYLFGGFDFHLLVFVNGNYSEELSRVGELPAGAVIGSLRKYGKENNPSLKKYINTIVKTDNAFNALNNAFFTDGLFVYVPAGKIIEKPVQVLFLNGDADENVLSVPRNLIVAEDNSQVKMIINYRGNGGKEYLSNIVSEVFVGENAVVDLYKIQEERKDSYHIEKLQAYQKRSSLFNHYNIAFGGRIARNDINSVLDDENIETHFYGLYLANGDQHIDNHTLADHAKPNCMSNELYKGILDDNARGVFNGKIMVHKDAQKTNAYQSNKTILLSKTAGIDTKPQLEIFADDVKCSHGAAIGHLDDEAGFYIRTRGIPEELANSMLIRAFANDVIENVKIEELKEQLNHKIFDNLHRIEIENK